ncbi:hypothetical protein [Enterococcus faecalis]|uniref:hypothetical protein n=1 Tax=Enterococcus TaxID=1350 RepID=UPI0007094A5B|nr:hypothetical protein [Enterococcus faecalis]KXF71667.1 hypothetical protein AQ486_03535 [Enterococcus faecalis]KXF73968.1 hypothetical protein AQ487_03885 [Enterococcus faecalis]MBC2812585.1 hypothetical protein [Enterococcus faecalis]MBC2816485.1 hypothetical protein [Enterococcus faecalis]MBC2819496.1 hypothetical protein [Enterococcus faecalis]
MTASIKSDISVAQEAVSHYGKSGSINKMSTLGESNLSGMKTAMEVSNEIIGEVLKLQSGIKKQADKFPKLASVIEQRDKQDANAISNDMWGASK